MNKYFIILLFISFSSVHAVDDEHTFEKGVKQARDFFQNVFKENNNRKELPRGSDTKPKGQTRPIKIILQKEEMPAIIEEQKEIKNELPQIEKEAKRIDQEKQSTTEKITAAIVNNPKRIAAVVVVAGFLWMIWNADSSGSESSK